MPTLTLEAIRENPWNAVVQTLPAHPEPILLEVAYLAARYCRDSEFLLMLAARAGSYTPRHWKPGEHMPDVHEENEARSHDADTRLQTICDLYEKEFGEPMII